MPSPPRRPAGSARSRSCRAWPPPGPGCLSARADAPAGGGRARGLRRVCSRCSTRPQLDAVGTPADCSILVTSAVDGAKNVLFTLVHPPRYLIVNSCGGVGNLLANCLATEASTGRYPCWAQIV